MKTQIEEVKVSDLREYERNARTHSKKQVEQVARSIDEFGFTNPILIDRQGMIIAGHGRLQAAKLLGLESVPCIRLGHLKDDQVKALVLADNRIAEGAGWNVELVKSELKALEAGDFDVSLVGFDVEDLLAETSGSPARVKSIDTRKPPAIAWVLLECPIAEFGKVQLVLDQLPEIVETYTTYTDERKD